MNKIELRAACKAAKIKNYSKMTVAGMRAALTKLTTIRKADTTLLADAFPAPAKAKPAAKKDSEPRVPPVEQNGVRAPIKGVCADVWTACDDWLASTEAAPKAADLREPAEKRNWNQNNVSIEVSRWRKYHGFARPAKPTA